MIKKFNKDHIKKVVIDEVKEEKGIFDSEILFEEVIHLRHTNIYFQTPVAYFVIITKKKLIMVSIDINYRIVRKHIIDINKIRVAGRAGIGKCILIPEEQLIEFNDVKIYLDPTHGGQEEKIMRLIRILRKLGVKDVEYEGYSINIILNLIIYLMIALAAIFIFINFLN